MVNQLMIKPEKCVGCKTCEVICAFNHENNFDPINSAVSVQILPEASVCVPVMCMQCEAPSCVSICPAGAMQRA